MELTFFSSSACSRSRTRRRPPRRRSSRPSRRSCSCRRGRRSRAAAAPQPRARPSTWRPEQEIQSNAVFGQFSTTSMYGMECNNVFISFFIISLFQKIKKNTIAFGPSLTCVAVADAAAIVAAAEGLVGRGVGRLSAEPVLGLDRVDGRRYAV